MSDRAKPVARPHLQQLLLGRSRRPRPRDRRRHRQGTRPPARRDRADRLGEHRLARRSRGAGLGDDQQIRRGLSRPALLWRLPVRRHRRDAGDRARLPAVRLQVRQRPAELRLAGQPGRVPGADEARRHLHGPRPRRRRPSDARRAAQHVGQVVQGRQLRREAARTRRVDMDAVERLAHEHKPKLIIAGGSGYAAPLGFRPLPRDRRRGRRDLHGRHGAFRRAGGRRRRIPRRSRTPTS